MWHRGERKTPKCTPIWNWFSVEFWRILERFYLRERIHDPVSVTQNGFLNKNFQEIIYLSIVHSWHKLKKQFRNSSDGLLAFLELKPKCYFCACSIELLFIFLYLILVIQEFCIELLFFHNSCPEYRLNEVMRLLTLSIFAEKSKLKLILIWKSSPFFKRQSRRLF